MSYLQDRKNKEKKLIGAIFFIVIFLILIYFRSGIFNSFAYLGQTFFRPVLVLGHSFGGRFSNVGSFFASKSALSQENEDLKSKLNDAAMMMANYNSILVENMDLKEILGRKNTKTPVVLSAILSKPNQSPYDTLVIDVGDEQKIKAGNIVFAVGNIPIGRISDVYPGSSKVVLFSNSGEKTQVIISGKKVFMEVVGRGGGNFEMVLPRDLTLPAGEQVVLPGINPYVLATVETIISDPRDPFQKALLVSPVNIAELKFVEVESSAL